MCPGLRTPFFLGLLCACAGVRPVCAQDASVLAHRPAIAKILDEDYPRLDALYKDLHAHPELGLNEVRTAKVLAEQLSAAGFTVTMKVGGHGVVGVLKNGAGPTILVRADMDGLPIEEKTGLPYASKVQLRDAEGRLVGVMHACGHDANMTCLVGTARALYKLKDHWRGTLVFIGQPAEEIGAGARMMLEDGLFKRFPRPDYAFALHCDARYPHGHVNYRLGQLQANVDSVDIVVKGKGGHGAAPQASIDPIVLGARLVLDLQTIVSREVDPTQSAVVTVGSFHGGTKHNIIPDEVRLQLTVRTLTDKARTDVLEAIARRAKALALAARAPEPEMRVNLNSYTPALVNDNELTKKTMTLLRKALGDDHVHERPMSMGGEDFSRFGREGVPVCYFFLGTQDPKRFAESKLPGGRPLALTHTAYYYPIPEPTIRTGVLSMTLAVLNVAR